MPENTRPPFSQRVAHFFGIARPKHARTQVPAQTAATGEPKASNATAREAPSATPTVPTFDDVDDPLAEMAGEGRLAHARRRERARCEAIMTSPLAADHRELAAQLAFTTRMPREDALRFLAAQPPSAASTARAASLRRAARNPQI